jgi:hypothetical protein
MGELAMKRLLLSALLLGAGVVGAAEPVSVHPQAPASLNQSLPQALMQAAPAVSTPTMTSTPCWTPTATACAAPNYLACNTGRCAPTCATKAMPGCGPGPSLTRPYVNLMQPPGWLNRCDDGTCSRGNLLERLGAWLSFSRSGHDAPCLSARPLQAPLLNYFPCKPTAGCGTCATGTCAGGPVQGGRMRNVYNPLMNRCETGTCATGTYTPTRSIFDRMLGFFTPEGFGFSSGGSGTCNTGACDGLGSTCTSGRVRYADPMSRGTASGHNAPAHPAAPMNYPGTLVPTSPAPAPVGTPSVMPSSYIKPVKVNPAMTPLTNP